MSEDVLNLEDFRTLYPNGARIVRVSPTMGGYWDIFDDENAGRNFFLHDGHVLIVSPWSGGHYHGGEFDTDGAWPQIGDTIFNIEPSHGKLGKIEWSAVRIQSSVGDMRAVVRDHGDDYGYGAGLDVELRIERHTAHCITLADLVAEEGERLRKQHDALVRVANDNVVRHLQRFTTDWHAPCDALRLNYRLEN